MLCQNTDPGVESDPILLNAVSPPSFFFSSSLKEAPRNYTETSGAVLHTRPCSQRTGDGVYRDRYVVLFELMRPGPDE